MPAASSKNPTEKQLKAYHQLVRRLYSRIPTFFGNRNQQALDELIRAARRGYPLPTAAIARAAIDHHDAAIRAACLEFLRGDLRQDSLDAVWKTWSKDRNEVLQDILLARGRPAADPARMRVLSLLLLDDASRDACVWAR